MTTLELIYWIWNNFSMAAGTAFGEFVLHMALTSPDHYVGQFFVMADGMATWWAIIIDNLIDDLGVVKGDH